MVPATDEALLSMREAARWLGLRPDTLKKMAQRGEISSVKYRKLRLFEPRVIRAFIESHRTDSYDRAV
jgi:excisionase family DNA binding protein